MAGAEGIIRELAGIRGRSNPNLHIDGAIISLVFKSDYMLQLKEASAGSFMGTATTRARVRRILENSTSQRAALVVTEEWLSHEVLLNMGGDAETCREIDSHQTGGNVTNCKKVIVRL